MTEFATWEMIGTYAGCVAITTIVTQFLKGVPALNKIHTQFVSYFVALFLLIGANFFVGEVTVATMLLTAVNAVIVSLASNGTYDVTNMIKSK